MRWQLGRYAWNVFILTMVRRAAGSLRSSAHDVGRPHAPTTHSHGLHVLQQRRAPGTVSGRRSQRGGASDPGGRQHNTAGAAPAAAERRAAIS